MPSALDPSEQRFVAQLNDAGRGEVKAAFDSLAHDHTPRSRPAPAPYGRRWSDIPLAIPRAADDAEMGVVESSITDRIASFRLRTVDDRPAWLEMRATGDPRVFEITRAEVGWFGTDEAAASRLREAVDRWMRRFGAKPQFED